MCTRNFAAIVAMSVAAFFMTLSASANDIAAQAGHADPVAAKRVKGSYALDDGRTLRVSEKGRKLYADLGDGPVQIRHVGDERFEAVGADLRLDFKGGPFPYAVTLSAGSGRQVASNPR